MEPKMLNELVKLPHAAQIIYLQLLNRAAQGTVTVSDRDLATSCRLNAQSITDGKRALKNAEFVDFKTERGKPTTYQLTPVQFRVQGAVHSDPNTNISNTIGLPPPPPPPPAYARRLDELERRIAALEAKSAPSAPVQSAPSEELDEVIAQWDSRANFAPLGTVGMTKLQAMLERHTASELIAAMDEAELANKPRMGSPYSGVSFVFFEKVLAGRREGKATTPPKEVKKDDGGIKYRVPRSDGAKPWRKRDTIGEPVASETSVG